MAADANDSGGSRTLRAGGVVLLAIALTGFFMVLTFPYDRLADRLVEQVERQTGMRLHVNDVSVALVRFGPGLAAEGVRIQQPDGTRLDLDRVAVRPALSMSWLSGAPAVATELAAGEGEVSGVATLGELGGFVGTLAAVDLAVLPQRQLGLPLQLEGIADADIDVAMGEEGPEGRVVFDAADGTLTHPDLPIPLPYETLSGEIDLGGEALARIARLDLSSPLASGNANGTIGKARNLQAAPLSLDVKLQVSGMIRGSLNAQGVRVGRNGNVDVSITGTVGRPIVR